MPRHWFALLILLLVCLLSLRDSVPLAEQHFQPPRAVTCAQDPALLGFSRNVRARESSRDRFLLPGFSVERPVGPDWCEGVDLMAAAMARLYGEPIRAIRFGRNNYGGEILRTPPPPARRANTFLAIAFLGKRNEGDWSLAWLRGALATCGGGCTMETHEEAEVSQFNAACLRFNRLYRFGKVMLYDQGFACIHPNNSRFQVTVLVSEKWLDGARYYEPPLMRQARDEYEPFLNSLRFTDSLPKRRTP